MHQNSKPLELEDLPRLEPGMFLVYRKRLVFTAGKDIPRGVVVIKNDLAGHQLEVRDEDHNNRYWFNYDSVLEAETYLPVGLYDLSLKELEYFGRGITYVNWCLLHFVGVDQ